MKVSFVFENKDFKKNFDFIKKFIELLQRKFPLKNDLKIFFLDKQKGEMSTGSRRPDNVIKVLVSNRMNRDIMRTLSHEWVHEYQMDVLKRKKGPNIGGRNEDEANAFAGQLIKIFEKENPEMEQFMYEHKGIQKRMDLLNESIILTEKKVIEKNLINEMKKIGIEKLPYSYSSLSRFIDSETMNVHYNKHYKGYVKKLNDALSEKNYKNLDLEQIVTKISRYNDKIRNNAGGAFNHALFWKMLSPKKQLPKGEILKKINSQFGSLKLMKEKFKEEALNRFGSGWVWLISIHNGSLKIMSTPNQDNPIMDIVKKGGYPILGLDLWEHAYYLKYKNKREDYINNFWNHVNWEFVNQLYIKKKNKEIINEIAIRPHSKIDYLCDYNLKNKILDSPFCELKKYKNELKYQNIINSIETSIIILDKFFHLKTSGNFPKIVDLSLQNKERTKNFLELISDFLVQSDLNNDKKNKIISLLNKKNILPNTLEELLSYIRAFQHQEYEKSYEGDDFESTPKKLQLNYKCSDDQKEKFFESLQEIKNEKKTIDVFFSQITDCLNESFLMTDYNVKADIKSKNNIYDMKGNIIFEKGSYFEIKKMDPFIDSYLSEFFSIFKESKIKNYKPEFINLYNLLIDKIYKWILTSKNAELYLKKIKENLTGIVYENKIIVPIENIELYWSNKGQRNCLEKRLSIRFRIKQDLKTINAYRYLGKNSVSLEKLNVPFELQEKIICD